ncbi:hypothetical protein [Thalassotalea maritima]|uniref:hypothetical protein n=1 Tax=Thalassotalea maritima TaxID=3242416 RepID=UPI0035296B0B
MNLWFVLSGMLALFTVVGHFTVGKKQFLTPMLTANVPTVAKHVMHCVFHYVSVFLLLSTLVLLLAGFGVISVASGKVLATFIASNYLAFALWQIIIALRSGLEKPLLKLFQWLFFVAIGGFAMHGAMIL